MNRILAIALGGTIAVAAVFAQSGRGYSAAPGGFGNVLYPGTGRAPQTQSSTPRPSASRGGYNAGQVRGGAPPNVGHPTHGRRVVVPYPVYVGSYGGYGYGGGYVSGFDTPAPVYYQDQLGYGQQQGDAGGQAVPPVVIINQSYRPETANPQFRDYSDAQLPETPQRLRTYDAPVHPTPDPRERAQAMAESERPTIYLIAFKDHTVLAALAYWIEGDTLKYVTKDGKPNSASLSLVDRDLSRQMNKQLNVDFNLP